MLEVLIPLFILSGVVYLLRILPGIISRHDRKQSNQEGWVVEFSRKTWSVYTESFNSIPAALVSQLPSRLVALYDVGSVFGLIGCAFSIGASLWALGSVWMAVWIEAKIHAMEQVIEGETFQEVVKRAMDSVTGVESDSASLSGGLIPLIPGITVPLPHLPTMILALILNQLLHELGHALAAACDNVSPSRLSFNLHLIVPSMMVTFPSNIDDLPPKSQLRLASSGPWHNCLTWLLISLFSLCGLGGLFWADMSSQGRVVHSVHPLSPLAGVLSPGMLITHLDDVFVGGTHDIWSDYLQSEDVGDAGRGWCVERAVYDAPPPCAQSNQITFQHTLPKNSETNDRCLAPHPMLDTPSGKCPCPGKKWVCVRPAAEENVLRIQVDGGMTHRENVILWSGDRRGVLLDVEIGTKEPRFLGGIVRWSTMFLEYMGMIALSLYLFNMLPLPGTDGSHFLDAILTLRRIDPTSLPTQKPLQAILTSPGKSVTQPLTSYDDHDLSDDEEAFERGGKRNKLEDKWKGRIRKGVEIGMASVVIGWVAGWAILALLRSS